jgi:hypothetical protein
MPHTYCFFIAYLISYLEFPSTDFALGYFHLSYAFLFLVSLLTPMFISYKRSHTRSHIRYHHFDSLHFPTFIHEAHTAPHVTSWPFYHAPYISFSYSLFMFPAHACLHILSPLCTLTYHVVSLSNSLFMNIITHITISSLLSLRQTAFFLICLSTHLLQVIVHNSFQHLRSGTPAHLLVHACHRTHAKPHVLILFTQLTPARSQNFTSSLFLY